MFRRTVLVAVIAALWALLSPSCVLAQSKEEGDRLLKEGVELRQKAKSKEDMKRAVQKYEEALRTFSKVGDLKGEAAVLRALGNAHKDLSQYDKAADYYQKFLEIAKKVGDAQGEGGALGSLGIVYYHLGQYGKAVEYWRSLWRYSERWVTQGQKE